MIENRTIPPIKSSVFKPFLERWAGDAGSYFPDAIALQALFEATAHSSPEANDMAAYSLESRKIVDSYLYFLMDSELFTPNGESVETTMERWSYLGKNEGIALDAIKQWMVDNDRGFCVWFSPPYQDTYEGSKFIVSELYTTENGVKALLNRAVVINADGQGLLDLAKDLTPDIELNDIESLRSIPLFPTPQQINRWLNRISTVAPQVDMIKTGEDIQIKSDTLATLRDIQETIPIVGNNEIDRILYDVADRRGLIGNGPVSCPLPERTTPFETFSNHSLQTSETKKLNCTCPFCKKKVEAVIMNGKIRCPKCEKSAPYKC